MIELKDGATRPKVLPIYQRRMVEQAMIGGGTLKRGHRDFGFRLLEGYS
jgi:hypothetical protein